MTTRCSSDSFDPAQPALIVTYGNTPKKHRALNRPALVLGRARGCDIGLVAPDVSNVHCVIVRQPEGFVLRDCASRSGTRLNGQAVAEATLRDGDNLQIGPFSFQVYLPATLPPVAPAAAAAAAAAVPAAVPAPAATERMRHLESSRRNLARHALALRRQLRENGNTAAELAAQQVDLDRRAMVLRDQIKELEQRARRLVQAERDLASDREALNHDAAALQARIEQGEREWAQRQAEAEAALQARQEELEKQLLEQQENPHRAEPVTAPVAERDAERCLAIQRRELGHFAHYLHRNGQRLRHEEQRLGQARQHLSQFRRQLEAVRAALEAPAPQHGEPTPKPHRNGVRKTCVPH
jgi:hypothetical protein